MPTECYRINVPEGARLVGFTAAGQRVPIVPGEHVVQRVKPKVPLSGVAEALRFLGGDARGRDVHVPMTREVDFDMLSRHSGIMTS